MKEIKGAGDGGEWTEEWKVQTIKLEINWGIRSSPAPGWTPFFSKLRLRGVSQCGRPRYVHCSDERSADSWGSLIERPTVSCCRRTPFFSSALAATNPWEYYYYKYVYLAKRSWKLRALLCSKLHIVGEYNATVELVSTCHRMRMWTWTWTWVWARASCFVPRLPACQPASRPSSTVRFLIMKLGTNNRFCSAHFDLYIFGFSRVHFTQLLEKRRQPPAKTRCCLTIVCLRGKVNEKAAAVDGECVLYWVSDITQYNTIFSACNWINKGEAVG